MRLTRRGPGLHPRAAPAQKVAWLDSGVTFRPAVLGPAHTARYCASGPCRCGWRGHTVGAVGDTDDDRQARREGESGHRALPHTADVRVEAWGTTQEQCLEEAALGLVEFFADTSAGADGRRRADTAGRGKRRGTADCAAGGSHLPAHQFLHRMPLTRPLREPRSHAQRLRGFPSQSQGRRGRAAVYQARVSALRQEARARACSPSRHSGAPTWTRSLGRRSGAVSGLATCSTGPPDHQCPGSSLAEEHHRGAGRAREVEERARRTAVFGVHTQQ
ncbi:archease [Streptomyces gibsoniae]|uniref:Archease n=1 Tax=Streptomyces gibsoniae TaxID=3075529 RepID=A0ABU2U5Z9_9ACTN|nr:archease [Streptomyces sp. DSM 41699]MDT0468626.1 archease [Streptomyces sp. DSM 41699]